MNKSLFLSIMILIGLSACTPNNIIEEPLPTEPIKLNISLSSQKIVGSSSNFGIDLVNKVAEFETQKENWMISPLSITLALAMTYNGADGDTKKAMEETMRLKGLDINEINSSFKDLISKLLRVDKRVEIDIANSIWYKNGFSIIPDFIKVNRDFYGAEVKGLDFSNQASKDIINNWVAEHTNNKIPTIIDKIDPNTMMFLINAVYFKGLWKHRFNPDNNIYKPFYYKNGYDRRLEMMKRKEEFKTFTKDDIVMLEMPYGQGNWVIDLVMTTDKTSIDDVMQKLTTDQWNMLVGGLRTSDVTVVLPPFKFKYDLQLAKCLTELGMGVAFDIKNANFSKINNNRKLAISEVKHKTFIELNEKGTEAAAVTSVGLAVTSVGPSHENKIIFDKPFMFAIREISTNTIAFIGKVGDPKR